jgi:hypothetical protein
VNVRCTLRLNSIAALPVVNTLPRMLRVALRRKVVTAASRAAIPSLTALHALLRIAKSRLRPFLIRQQANLIKGPYL